MKKGKQGFRGGKDDDGVLVNSFFPVDLDLQERACAEDLAMGIRTLIAMDFWLGCVEFLDGRYSQVRKLFSHPFPVLKNEKGVPLPQKGPKNLFFRFREGEKTGQDHFFKTIQI